MKTIWAIGDLHFSFGTPGKEMDRFGENWVEHARKIGADWDAKVKPTDLVLLPGDISWAMRLEGALPDLQWIEARPGIKVMIRGNHDYWWESASKIRKVLPPSIHIISNDAFFYEGVAVAGVRLWDSPEYQFGSLIEIKGQIPEKKESADEETKIFERELLRLEMSLKAMKRDAAIKICMTHYPPIGNDLLPSRASQLIESYGVQHVLFGHLHSLKPGQKLFGKRGETEYHLTSCDFLDFKLLKVATF